jgi:hypothetical protein
MTEFVIADKGEMIPIPKENEPEHGYIFGPTN